MPVPFPNPTYVTWDNVSTAQDFLNNANASAGNWLFTGILAMVCGILFISLAIGFGWEAGLLTTAFVGLMLSTLFLYMGLVSFPIVGMFVGIIIIMIMYIIWSNKYD